MRNLTVHTTFMVYLACGLSALSYGNESWTPRANHEHKLNIFAMQYIRLLLSIVIDECHCLVMLLEWTMIDTKGALFMGSCIRELSQQAEHSFATSMSASETSNS